MFHLCFLGLFIFQFYTATSFSVYKVNRLTFSNGILPCKGISSPFVDRKSSHRLVMATKQSETHGNIPIPLSMLFQPLKNIWDFSRPHTIIGSSISIITLYLFAIPRVFWQSDQFLRGLKAALLPSLFANVYITGLNQVTDIEIDKINKPYLPLASGKMSKLSGISTVVICGILAVSLVIHSSAYLRLAVLGSMLLGTVYSLPPFRLKRFPLLAAFSILVVRGSLVNLGFFFDAKKSVLNQQYGSLVTSLRLFPESLAATVFFAVFGLVIALMKDVPDVTGDLNNNIRTFSVRLGSKPMFSLSTKLLATVLLTYSIGISSLSLRPSLLRTLGQYSISPLIVATSGVAFTWDVLRRARQIDAENPKDVFNYYMYTWNIFYACYLLLPILRI